MATEYRQFNSVNEDEFCLWIKNALGENEELSTPTHGKLFSLLLYTEQVAKERENDFYHRKQVEMFQEQNEMYLNIKDMNEMLKAILQRNKTQEEGKEDSLTNDTALPTSYEIDPIDENKSAHHDICIQERDASIYETDIERAVAGLVSRTLQECESEEGEQSSYQVGAKKTLVEQVNENEHGTNTKSLPLGLLQESHHDLQPADDKIVKTQEVRNEENKHDAQKQEMLNKEQQRTVRDMKACEGAEDMNSSPLKRELTTLKSNLLSISLPLDAALETQKTTDVLRDKCYQMLGQHKPDDDNGVTTDEDIPLGELIQRAVEKAESEILELQENAINHYKLSYIIRQESQEIIDRFEEEIEQKEQEVEAVHQEIKVFL